MTSLVVLDGDDTLWETERLYDEARQDAREIVESVGLDGAEWERRERALDQERVADFGFSPERFPGSCRLAYEELAPAVDPALSELVYKAAALPFERRAELYPDAADAVSALRAHGSHLVLFTKGDRTVQHKRIADSQLADCFDAILIVAHKTSDDFASLAAIYVPGRERRWSIGNSLRSDIVPALDAGFDAIWIDRHVWEHERHEPAEVLGTAAAATELHSLHEAVRYIADEEA